MQSMLAGAPFPAHQTTPLFSLDGRKPLTRYAFLKHTKLLLSLAGYKPELFSGHSFRRGGAQTAYDTGLSTDDIQIIGRWKNIDVARKYFGFTVSKLHSYQRAWQRPVPLVLSSSSYWKCNMKRELRLAATSGVWRSIASNLVHLNPPAVCAFSSKFYYNLNLTPNRCISVGLHSQHHSNNECYLHTVNENRNTAQFPPCAWTSHNVLTWCHAHQRPPTSTNVHQRPPTCGSCRTSLTVLLRLCFSHICFRSFPHSCRRYSLSH